MLPSAEALDKLYSHSLGGFESFQVSRWAHMGMQTFKHMCTRTHTHMHRHLTPPRPVHCWEASQPLRITVGQL